MAKENLFTPDFLFCELPIKDGSINDDRIWVYSTKSLSLIEFVNVDGFIDFELKNVADRFEYEHSDGIIENWFAVFVQNNCVITDNDPKIILKKAWQFLKDYFSWEDKNIDDSIL